jgi:hypothetical protein
MNRQDAKDAKRDEGRRGKEEGRGEWGGYYFCDSGAGAGVLMLRAHGAMCDCRSLGGLLKDMEMSTQANRKALRERYESSRPAAGVYRIVNAQNGRFLLGSSLNLTSVRNRLEFVQSTGSAGTLYHQLRDDIKQYGLNAFSFEILETLEIAPEMTEAQIKEDLATLESLWREKYDLALLY